MFLFNRTPIMYEEAGEGGGGAPAPAPTGEPAGAPAAPAPSPAAAPGAPVPAPAPAGAPAAPPAAPDPAELITQWGGNDAIAEAIRVNKALDTLEGQEALMVTHLRNRGYDNAAIEAFLHPAAPEPQGESIEQLLADPDRQLTAGEIARILDSRDQQSQQAQAERDTAVAINNAMSKTLTELAVPEGDRQVVLTLADQFLPQPGVVPNDPAVIDAAIRRGHAELQRRIEEAGKQYVENKGAAHGALPSPLPAGGGPGGEQPTEPQNLKEASERARAAILGHRS